MASASQTGSKAVEVVALGDWPPVLEDATKEVFSMMVGAQLAAAADGKPAAFSNVTGVIGIGGAFTGVLTVRCSMDLALKIAAQMLGVPAKEAASQCADAIGEICNMVAGSFKAKVGHEATCMLSIPTVIMGKDYRVHSDRCLKIEAPLSFDGETISIILEVRR